MAFLSLLLLGGAFLGFLVVEYLSKLRNNRSPAGGHKLPGPRGYPLIGSVPDLPQKNSFLKFHEWGQKYGPIYQCNLAGTNHVWISRDRIAKDLLAGRSAIYSDRPHIPALEQDNRTSGQYLPLMSKNEKWTRQRKFAKQVMDTSAKASFYNYPELESVRLLFELMTDPARYNHALESYIARITSRLAWGTPEPADELKQRARELLIGVSPSGALGNKLPLVMKLPEKWIPAKAWELRRSRTEKRFFQVMQDEVAQRLGSVDAPSMHDSRPVNPTTSDTPQSWTRQFLERKSSWGFASDLEGAYAVGMHGIAGALTIAAPMQSFCLAMCHFPQYQHVLHEEIDRVLGDRMPRFSDMPDMPVLRAFIRETMRWRPPVPTGIPHQLTQDDVYDGYHIPAGSVIHPLEWSISRDPSIFFDPDAFNPLRWLEPQYPTYQEPLTKYPTITGYSQFGYGRRTCQGMGVTDADLFVGIGSIAWLFNMSIPDADIDTAQSSQSGTQPTQPEQAVAGSGPPTPPSENESERPLAVHDLTYKLLEAKQGAASATEAMPGQFPSVYLPDNVSIQHGLPTPPESRRHSAVEESIEAPFVDAKSPLATTPSRPDPDPTLEYSSLLIAKPKPFKFDLTIRNQGRADFVAREWLNLKMEGEFGDSRVYWTGGNHGDAMYGWGEVTS